MIRKEEIRQAALVTKQTLVGAPDYMSISKASVNELVDTILELTAPESAPVEESQEGLADDFFTLIDDPHLHSDAARWAKLQSKFYLIRKERGRAEGDKKVSPDLDKYYDLETKTTKIP